MVVRDRDDFLAELKTDPAAFLRAAWKRCQGRDTITCASLGDLVTYLPCDLMTKVDRSDDLENLLEQVLKNSDQIKKLSSDLQASGKAGEKGGNS